MIFHSSSERWTSPWMESATILGLLGELDFAEVAFRSADFFEVELLAVAFERVLDLLFVLILDLSPRYQELDRCKKFKIPCERGSGLPLDK